MVIDFHVHAFPDKIARRTIETLKGNMYNAFGLRADVSHDGTVDDLRRSMAENGVDLSVIMPIATKVTQYLTINAYAEKITDNRKIISFASLHPYQDNVKEVLDGIAARGFRGIKLHPDYQGVFADDEKFIALVRRAAELGLYVTIHAGKDMGVPPPNKGSARHLRGLLNKTDCSRVILAHMGAFREWDEAEGLIEDFCVYIDTSVVSRFIDREQYIRIIEKRGADRVLFGSDAPWENPKDSLAFLKASGVSDTEYELITHANAERILFGG